MTEIKKIPKNLVKEQVDSSNFKLTQKQKIGDAANQWLEKNRSLVLRQTPFWAQGLVAILISLGGISLLGGIFFRIDEVVTVQGQLKSIGGTVEIKTPIGGKVQKVFFEDGEFVKKGQLLIQFDTREAAEQKKTLLELIGLETDQVKSQLESLKSQVNSIVSRKKVLQKKLDTKKIIIDSMEELVNEGGFQRLQFLEQKDQLFELEAQLSELEEQRVRILLESQQIQFESNKSIGQMRNNLKSAEVQLQYQNVTATTNGIVFDPQARSEGVLQAGERIVSIVPQQGLYAEVFVPNKDIGFIKNGQDANVRIDAFPFTRYGELEGSVGQIAADALEPDQKFNFYRFPVKINLTKNYLESDNVKIPLKPGMAITTNLKLRDKRVISLLSDLLVDQTDSVRSIRQQ